MADTNPLEEASQRLVEKILQSITLQQGDELTLRGDFETNRIFMVRISKVRLADLCALIGKEAAMRAVFNRVADLCLEPNTLRRKDVETTWKSENEWSPEAAESLNDIFEDE